MLPPVIKKATYTEMMQLALKVCLLIQLRCGRRVSER